MKKAYGADNMLVGLEAVNSAMKQPFEALEHAISMLLAAHEARHTCAVVLRSQVGTRRLRWCMGRARIHVHGRTKEGGSTVTRATPNHRICCEIIRIFLERIAPRITHLVADVLCLVLPGWVGKAPNIRFEIWPPTLQRDIPTKDQPSHAVRRRETGHYTVRVQRVDFDWASIPPHGSVAGKISKTATCVKRLRHAVSECS